MFLLPVATLTKITSGFGPRVNPVTGQYQASHNGLDLAAPTGTPVLAAKAGRVTYAGWDSRGINGNWIRLDHGGGLATGYLHLSRIDVAVGASVSAGQRIGAVGSTGRSTGPHLHFIAWKNGVAVDPKPLIAWGLGAMAVGNAARVWVWGSVAAAGILALLWLRQRSTRGR